MKRVYQTFGVDYEYRHKNLKKSDHKYGLVEIWFFPFIETMINIIDVKNE